MSSSLELELLDSACEPHPWSKSEIESLLSKNSTKLFTHEHEGATVGWCLAQVIPPEVEILRLGVHPNWRRKGIASGLIRELVSASNQEQVKRVLLEVKEGLVPAITLYSGLGFTQFGEREGYYRDGSKALLMELQI